MKSYLSKGVPELGIQQFEPYQAENLELTLTDKFDGKAIFSNITMRGLTNFIVNNVE